MLDMKIWFLSYKIVKSTSFIMTHFIKYTKQETNGMNIRKKKNEYKQILLTNFWTEKTKWGKIDL